MTLNYLLKSKKTPPPLHVGTAGGVLWALKCNLIYFLVWSCCFFFFLSADSSNLYLTSWDKYEGKKFRERKSRGERLLCSWFRGSGAAFVKHVHPSSPIFQIRVRNVPPPLFSALLHFFFLSHRFCHFIFFSSLPMSLCLTPLLLTSTFF